MNVIQLPAERAGECQDVVVVIDVLRAFTTAAFAFAAGAREILLVRDVDQAFALRKEHPDALLMGEDAGIPIDGFDLGNSPAALENRELGDRQIVFRSSSGTRAAVAARDARVLLVGSFVCADATVRLIRRHQPAEVALVLSGQKQGKGGDDDGICADYLQALLAGDTPELARYQERLWSSQGAERFKRNRDAFPIADLELAGQADRFDFAMQARPQGDLLIVTKVAP